MLRNFTLECNLHRVMSMKAFIITFFTVLFCLNLSIGWSLDYKDLVERDRVYYMKFSDVPFTGEITGQEKGLMRNSHEKLLA